MGLRELKAERVRTRILDVAQSLFASQGFEETTMEQIAERAEVGSTTLYRYFPSKGHLAIGPLNNGLGLGDALRRRPIAEPLTESLGAVIMDSFSGNDDESRRLRSLVELIDANSAARASMRDMFEDARQDLADALADRLGQDKDSPYVLLTSRITFAVWEFAWVRWAENHSKSPHDAIGEILSELSQMTLVVPTVPTALSH